LNLIRIGIISGTTNLLSYILRNQFKTHQEYLDFGIRLIDKIGMKSMVAKRIWQVIMWALLTVGQPTRENSGLLYLHKGNWNGEQI
jgi:hypothetical protein